MARHPGVNGPVSHERWRWLHERQREAANGAVAHVAGPPGREALRESPGAR